MAARRHNRDDVVRSALELLDEGGVEAITLRGLAKRMGVHLNSVSFQVTSKARLFELMAEAIFGEMVLDDLPVEPRARIAEVTRRLRSAMLSHRDGGRVVGGTDTADVNAQRYAELTISAFLELGVGEVTAARASVALHCLMIGLVEEEQAERSSPARARGMSALDRPGLARVARLLDEDSYDARAEFGIEGLINQALLRPASVAG